MRLHSCLLLLVLGGTAALAQSSQPNVEFRNSPEIKTPPGYSHAVVVSGGRTIFLAGQVGLDKNGVMVGKNDFRAQAMQAFVNLKAVLAAAGATSKDIVKLNYYVTGLDRAKLGALREVRDQFIDKEHPPVSTLVGVQALFSEDAMLELEAVAVVAK